jgi:hypothetical protein
MILPHRIEHGLTAALVGFKETGGHERSASEARTVQEVSNIQTPTTPASRRAARTRRSRDLDRVFGHIAVMSERCRSPRGSSLPSMRGRPQSASRRGACSGRSTRRGASGRRNVAKGPVGCGPGGGPRRYREAGSSRPAPHVRPAVPLGGRRTRADPVSAGACLRPTTERYLGCKQKLRIAVNDRLGIEPDAA